ncbi:hypothetical protein [Paraburkholderia humisilvae]|uniref:hypothetical protein n=1 Tax=Paraburkholderia humisilvae TaxID=627669 RepID=UPI0015824352|nr:hypothetical protein [Paraburkholderia humisilvae]
MEARTRVLIKGWLCVTLLGVAVSEVEALIFVATFFPFSDSALLPVILAHLASTVILVMVWAVRDARSAYQRALDDGYVRLAPRTRVVTGIARDCPRRWLVVLHIQLHPELIDL